MSVTPADPSATNPPAVAAAGLPAAEPDSTGPTDSAPPAAPTTPSTAPPTEGPTDTGPAADLPGLLVDSGPAAGDRLAVVGVNYDDVLNVRAVPGVDQQVVARLTPLEREVIATGATRVLAESLWHQVSHDGVTGWASAAFLGYMGATADATAETVAAAGRTPQATSVHGLGRAIAAMSDPGGSWSRIRVSAPGALGDHADVTVDVVGLTDDSVAGYRLHVFATRLPDDTAYVLGRVERTVICSRGVVAGVCQ
ncbi:MAG: SH3 domain-containing protein [Actinomycetota bacterium]|nr:SH3 domain-containing protein [Actinomycetota bacterium]